MFHHIETWIYKYIYELYKENLEYFKKSLLKLIQLTQIFIIFAHLIIYHIITYNKNFCVFLFTSKIKINLMNIFIESQFYDNYHWNKLLII